MHQTDTLQQWFTSKQGKYVDVIIAGRIFGGRSQESPQMPREYTLNGQLLTLRFATTETLVVTKPSGFTLGEYGQLIIPDAEEVQFGWHYYGRPQTPDNWCEEKYKKRRNRIELVRSGPCRPALEDFTYDGDRFVELL